MPESTTTTTTTTTTKSPDLVPPTDRTRSWEPRLDRAQSWSIQDRKHSLQMPVIDAVKTGPGFTEKQS
ncbi:hypothetical protein XA68_11713 [Ophiocordyceps unilateralis]|uniref:Uncharacterized protein n=1 Tax=Ophiocordyceps unilateralis TaxID=268505 RepID=A0A2A9PFA8_OPHUN|nr:hypothetical protein XA68_11713 [Ophiocordyceps unilateralis]